MSTVETDEPTEVELLENAVDACAVELNENDHDWWDVWVPAGGGDTDDLGAYWDTLHVDDVQELAERGEVQVYDRATGAEWDG